MTSGIQTIRLFDPDSQTYQVVNTMDRGRWYPSVTVMADGNLLIVGGLQQVMTSVTIIPPPPGDPFSKRNFLSPHDRKHTTPRNFPVGPARNWMVWSAPCHKQFQIYTYNVFLTQSCFFVPGIQSLRVVVLHIFRVVASTCCITHPGHNVHRNYCSYYAMNFTINNDSPVESPALWQTLFV